MFPNTTYGYHEGNENEMVVGAETKAQKRTLLTKKVILMVEASPKNLRLDYV